MQYKLVLEIDILKTGIHKEIQLLECRGDTRNLIWKHRWIPLLDGPPVPKQGVTDHQQYIMFINSYREIPVTGMLILFSIFLIHLQQDSFLIFMCTGVMRIN